MKGVCEEREGRGMMDMLRFESRREGLVCKVGRGVDESR